MAHPKGVLLERAAKLGFERPEFRTERTGPEHEPNFITDVVVDGEVLGTGQGGSKRTAETRAAEEALAHLDARDAGKTASAKPTGGGRAAGAGKAAGGAKPTGGGRAANRAGAATAAKSAVDTVTVAPQVSEDDTEDEMTGEFDGPWPMFDDLLAAVLGVAERRVSSELRGDQARAAIRDFSLTLYKELLADLGEVVEADEDEG